MSNTKNSTDAVQMEMRCLIVVRQLKQSIELCKVLRLYWQGIKLQDLLKTAMVLVGCRPIPTAQKNEFRPRNDIFMQHTNEFRHPTQGNEQRHVTQASDSFKFVKCLGLTTTAAAVAAAAKQQQAT